ncbi:unnamed protein product [Thelazia callipaeda]|uniref:C2H2-type domain-containing protein n=1 Tax=Thelazia callipaeda TaxID=103827 RepID=A0A0N5CTC1_THECL|nr:unnamed protein product [Thelazia callipaeda]
MEQYGCYHEFSDCGFCKHRFQTLKEWRIHAAKIHRRDGYCAACTYYLTLPHAFTTEQKQAAVEVHMLYCCPRAHESILDDRRVKRNRLELTETGEMAQHLHSPGEIFFY